MAAPGVDPQVIARAWELHIEGRSARYIGEALGVSHTTAADYVRRGREAETVIDLLDRAEQRTRSAARLDWMSSKLVDELINGQGVTAVQVVPVLVQVETRLARLLGLDAPTKLAVSDGRELPPVDPVIVAAVREAQSRSAREVRALGGAPPDGEDPPPS